jgi:hypothetical protein
MMLTEAADLALQHHYRISLRATDMTRRYTFLGWQRFSSTVQGHYNGRAIPALSLPDAYLKNATLLLSNESGW